MGFQPTLFRALVLGGLVCAVVGYGAVAFAVLLGPLVRRLDAADAAAVARAGFRLGARRAEQAIMLVGPLGAAAVASSDGDIAWSTGWFWAAQGAWLGSVLLRSVLVQPARRTQLVLLGELAGGPSDAASRRGAAAKLAQRMQIGLLGIFLLFVAAAALVTFQPWS